MSRFLTNSLPAVIASLCLSGCVTSRDHVDQAASARQYPAVAANRFARAIGYMDAGNDASAQRELERLGEEYPEVAAAHLNLGIIHGRAGRPDAAEAALMRAVNVCTRCASAYNHLGIAQREQGQFDAAERSYLAAIEADPDYAFAYYNLGVLYDLYQGRAELALKYYEAYVERETRPEETAEVNKWIIDLKRRTQSAQKKAANGAGVS